MTDLQQQQEPLLQLPMEHHELTDDEVNQLLYLWDTNATSSVNEYLYMKKKWKIQQQQQQQQHSADDHGQQDVVDPTIDKIEQHHGQSSSSTLRKHGTTEARVVDTGNRTQIDRNNKNKNMEENQEEEEEEKKEKDEEEDDEEEDVVFLELDTSQTAHVIEFYVPWCGHCQAFKHEYITMAKEISSRSIGIPVQFHAVSCDLFTMICRAYDISGFPYIMGYKVGMSMKRRGRELNPINGPPISIETIVHDLGLTLAVSSSTTETVVVDDMKGNNQEIIVQKDNSTVIQKNVTDNHDQQEEVDQHQKRQQKQQQQLDQANEAANQKQTWQEYSSTLDERYHNAAVSLVFLLKSGVYIDHHHRLEETRLLALKEFLELLDWTTPSSWSIRTGLVRELLDNIHIIGTSYDTLIEIINRHAAATSTTVDRTTTDKDTTTSTNQNTDFYYWGGLQNRPPPVIIGKEAYQLDKTTTGQEDIINNNNNNNNRATIEAQIIRNNTRWTQACTHDERGMGYTCGLWNLFHIITIGSSQPSHQLYGFLEGHLTSPTDVAEIIKRFIVHFFACDVCRTNFVQNFNDCGQDHCIRLATIMPALLLPGEWHQQQQQQWGEVVDSNNNNNHYHHYNNNDPNVELALWFLEVHNVVNIRLMRERAERQHRLVTDQEIRSAMFPPLSMCPKCWLFVSEQEKDETGNSAGEESTAAVSAVLVTSKYESHAMIHFLQDWYWPLSEQVAPQFQTVLLRRSNNNRKLKNLEESIGMMTTTTMTTTSSGWMSVLSIVIGVCCCCFVVAWMATVKKKKIRMGFQQVSKQELRKIV